MKSRTLISVVILIMVVLIIAGSCATGKKIISVDDAMKQFEGVYVNTEYSGQDVYHPQKFVITNKWIDSTGNIWYTLIRDAGEIAGQDYGLCKISDSGKTWEYIFASEDYPIEEWESDKFEYNYRIRYRQE